MTWLPWGRKKKKFDFNAFLVSQAKQKKHEEESRKYQLELGLSNKLSLSQTTNKADPTNNIGLSSLGESLRRASARAQSIAKTNFSAQPKSFSLVLTDDDLKGLELQQKLETLKRDGKQTNESQKKELSQLNAELGQSKKTLLQRLREGVDWSEYLEIAQDEIAAIQEEQKRVERGGDQGGDGDEDEGDAGSTSGSMASVQGRQEADLMKALHKVELHDRTRKRLQEFTSDEIMRLYKLESTIKEDFAEREAKILCEISKLDAHLKTVRAFHEQRLDISVRMIQRYEEAAQLHLERVYRALRQPEEVDQSNHNRDTSENSGSEDSDDDRELQERQPRPMLMKQSYSSRVLAVNAQEKEEIKKVKEEVSRRLSKMIVVEGDEGENNDPTMDGGDVYCADNGKTSNVPALAKDTFDSTTKVSSYARDTGASRNTRLSATRGAKSTGPPTRHGSSGSSSAMRAAALAAARARTAGRVASMGDGTSPRITGAKTVGGSPRLAMMKSSGAARSATGIVGRSNVAPRRVSTGTATSTRK
ncbi:hypothetical protein IV203_001445 [Nitzschia inconspicua]|uniref:Uncharacterized protein n=1 Tax=Nitzschia inconspicua TaxID=303405 RepID=A0A9K3PTK4_9STRA|nr:hypothetical protein IV203_001445 [Nitzschia inconspicua]